MNRKKFKDAFDDGKKVSELLSNIKYFQKEIGALNAALSAGIEKISAQYSPAISGFEKRLAEEEKQLVKLCKKNVSIFFGDSDRFETPSGVVVRSVKNWVVRVREMVNRLKTVGKQNLIKVSESADWDEIEKLSADDLQTLGTRREQRVDFSYEILSK